jgi:hypothetical protein
MFVKIGDAILNVNHIIKVTKDEAGRLMIYHLTTKDTLQVAAFTSVEGKEAELAWKYFENKCDNVGVTQSHSF